MGCAQSGQPPPPEHGSPSYLSATANAHEQRFIDFFAAHCERGVGMYCPFNEIAAALLSVAPIPDPDINLTDSIKVVDILLQRIPGIQLKGIRSMDQLTEYMYCVGMRLKSFPV